MFFSHTILAASEDSKVVSSVEEYVVVAPKLEGSTASLIEQRKSSSAVTEVLGGAQMSRAGDSDAGSSLRRVTGLTLVGGKFVYIRGMGERYSQVVLNGMQVPSPEPSHRVVPLDLFPSSILDSITVNKSYSPEMPSEFGGGLIQLKTKGRPEKNFIKIGVSAELRGDEKRMHYQGGNSDWAGRDDGTRRLPSTIRSALKSGRQFNENNPPFFTKGFSAEELASMGQSLKPIYNVREENSPPVPGLNFSIGRKHNIAGWQAGGVLALLYGSSGEEVEKKNNRYNMGGQNKGLVLDESSRSVVSEDEVKSAATLDYSMSRSDKHEISLNSLLLRHTSNQVIVQDSTRQNDSIKNSKKTDLIWVERQLLTAQLNGKHKLGVDLNWQAQSSWAERIEPDHREYTYVNKGQGLEMDLNSTGNRRTWSELRETSQQILVDMQKKFVTRIGDMRARLGATQFWRERESDVWRFHLRYRGDPSNLDLKAPPEDILGKVGVNDFVLSNLTESADSYVAKQTVTAQFFSLDWDIAKKWSTQVGGRLEQGEQTVKTFYYYNPNEVTSRSGLDENHFLPSVGVNYKANEQWRARLTYSQTLARPEFRELSTAPFIDDETGYETVGNANLKETLIQNIDHRWEYYPSSEESFSVGVFYKRFTKPIEEVFLPSPNLRKSYVNAASAENVGLELEGRTQLRRVHRGLRRWSVVGNVALIESKIKLSEASQGVQTSDSRPMQGQSPWMGNLQLQYDRPLQGTEFTILYNIIGPRISEVGTAARPDVYEQAQSQVDFVASQKIDKNLILNFRARNILDPEIKAKQGDEVVRSQNRGSSYYLSLVANY